MVYQAAQRLKAGHLSRRCNQMPEETHKRLITLQSDRKSSRDRKSMYGGGLDYWKQAVSALGVHETDQGLRFRRR